MSEAVAARPAKRRPHNRQLNPTKVLELAEKQVSTYDIAKHQGVNQSNVWRFLERHQIETQHTHTYKANRADLFARVSGMSVGVIEQVVLKIQEDIDNGVLDALTPVQKSAIARDLNIVAGTIYDKERLERGQSTQNISLIGKMMGSALDQSFEKSSSCESSDTPKQGVLPEQQASPAVSEPGDPRGTGGLAATRTRSHATEE